MMEYKTKVGKRDTAEEQKLLHGMLPDCGFCNPGCAGPAVGSFPLLLQTHNPAIRSSRRVHMTVNATGYCFRHRPASILP